MASYTLTSNGVQAITSGVTRLFVEVTTFPPGSSAGRATPTNFYELGLFRWGVGDYYFPAVPITGIQTVYDLPSGVTNLGYSLLDNCAVTVSESTPPPTGAWVLVSTGTLMVTAAFSESYSAIVPLPLGYTQIRLVADDGESGNSAGVFQGGAVYVAIINDTNCPVDASYTGSVTGDSVQIGYFSGDTTSTLTWYLYYQ